MDAMKCVVGGLVGGLIGAAIWGAIAYFTGYEIGWIAWAVGVVVGMGVRLTSGGASGAGLGVLASILALASIAGGKYAAAYLTVQSMVKAASKIEINDEQAQGYIANQLVREYEEAGKPLKWPDGKDQETAEEEKDYPPDLWKDMQSRWAQMSPKEQQDYRAQIKASFMGELQGASAGIAGAGAFEDLSAWDGLWAILALASAFRIGSGAASTSGDD